MARQEKEVQMERMPHLLDDILMRATLSKNEDTRVFQNIAITVSQSNGRNVPPLLITAEEHEQIQKDRKKAIEYEKQLEKRRQEKYFDLVDKVRSVLKRIEEKNSRKDTTSENTICEVSEDTSSSIVVDRSRMSNDFNNNPSPEPLRSFFEQAVSSKSETNGATVRQTPGFPGWVNPEKTAGVARQGRSGRYSLPADFNPDDGSPYSRYNHGSISEPMSTHSQTRTTRPASVFSDHPSLYSTSFQLSEVSTVIPGTQSNRLSCAGRSLETGPQAWTSSPPAVNNPQMFSSRSGHPSINNQRDMPTVERKRLEDHFSALQGQLLAEFQQRQNELLRLYKESMELQSKPDTSLEPTLERSASNVEEAVVLNTSDKENYELHCTDELPKSPFTLSPKRTSNPSQRSTPSVNITVRSFNSEASLQEFYDITHFGKNGRKNAAMEKKRKKGWIERRAEQKTSTSPGSPNREKKAGQSFGVSLCTTPKLTQLNSFGSQTKDAKNAQNHKFAVLSAQAKGFLTRRLFLTEKINSLVTTVKDAKNVLNEMKTETNQSMTDRSFKERVEAQLHSAHDELRKIFLDSSPHLRMQILEHNRRLVKEKQARNENKITAKAASQNRPRLSNVTMKRRLSRQERTNNSGGIRSLKSNTPSPSAAGKTTIASGETPTATPIEKDEPTQVSTVPSTTKTTSVNTTVQKTAVRNKEVKKIVRSTTSGKVTKPNKAVSAQTKTRRTWDTGVLKPIQGRISPTLPDKARSSGETKQPIFSTTTRKPDQKLGADCHQRGTQGAHGTARNSRIASKPCKVDNRQQAHVTGKETHVTRQGARRSLAANLTNK